MGRPSIARRVARNTAANWLGVSCNLVVVFLLTPFLVHRLGDERLGIYAVAQQFLSYVALVTLGMPGAVARFASRAVAAGDLQQLNRTLSTISTFFWIGGGVGWLLAGAFGVLAPGFFGVSAGYAIETAALFWAMGALFLLGLLELSYRGVLIGHQRYDLINLGECLRDLSRLGLVVLIVAAGMDDLLGLGAGLLVASLLSLAYFRQIAHRQAPGLDIRPHRPDRSALREIGGFGLWHGLVQVGNVVTWATPTLVVARVLGPEQVVFYAIPFLIVDRLRVVVASMASTLAPIAASTLVTGDRASLADLAVKGTRAAATLSLPAGAVLLVFCEPLLRLWMGEAYAWAWAVFGVLMIGMFGRLSQIGTLQVLTGGGRIRGLAIIQLGSAVLTCGLTVALASSTSLGVVAVALGAAIPLFLSHSILVPWYAARQLDLPLWRYYVDGYKGPLLSALVGFGVALLLRAEMPPASLLALSLEMLASLGAAAVLAWFVCLDKPLRDRLVDSLRPA